MIRRVAIVGVGLIGSSLGLAFQDINEIEEVIGIDKNSDYLQQALDIGAINRTDSLEEGVKNVDLVILATPVGIIKDLVQKILPYINPNTIITDVGSTKSNLVGELEKLTKGYNYIGGHPMTGSETVGPRGADKYLFENAIYVLTETENTRQDYLLLLKDLIERVGAQALILSPLRHDKIVAITSHLPHLVAVNLMSVIAELAEEDELLTSLIAGGFRDTTRISAGDPIMWRDIFLNNKDAVLDTISLFEEKLSYLKEIINRDSTEKLTAMLSETRDARLKLPMKKKGLLPSNFELILTLEDKPKAIAKVATLLGNNEINIQDIEVLKVREDGGTIRLSFRQEDEHLEAYQLLQQNSYKVTKK
ncbi:prephenate dehydrogenase [Orenia marismortui]|uniref:Prephenate dehydrogenase n=1 Tax=Orenia marismortui TaxID=46469 RepID=A0A4R8H170_9FIRM|nr:prephenate dehydrogenase [Orenia marismortui]TDX53312.1 prephenate dehydrogenase [Orenia marismortui]